VNEMRDRIRLFPEQRRSWWKRKKCQKQRHTDIYKNTVWRVGTAWQRQRRWY
jgi:ANTAR domain